jgi:hypothetical protein
VDRLANLLLQRRHLRSGGVNLCFCAGDVQVAGDTSAESFAREIERLLLRLLVVLCDDQITLRAAQIHVIHRDFGEQRHQDIIAIFVRCLDIRFSGFDISRHAAKDIDLPGCVETGIPEAAVAIPAVADGYSAGVSARSSCSADHSRGCAGSTSPRVAAIKVNVRPPIGSHHAALRASFAHPRGCLAKVVIILNGRIDDGIELRIIKRIPPALQFNRWARSRARGGFTPLIRDCRFWCFVVRPDLASNDH